MDKEDSQGGSDIHLVHELETCNYFILSYYIMVLVMVLQMLLVVLLFLFVGVAIL